jgi:nucleoside-diphosphate-sugar epimerase
VTGGAGFIGSHVAHHCLQQGHTVIVLDDLSGGFADHVPEGARLVADFIPPVRFRLCISSGRICRRSVISFIRRFNCQTNLIGAVNLIKEAVKDRAHNQVFNIGAEQPYTVNHLAQVIMEAFGVDTSVEHLPPREEVYHVYPNLEKAIRLLNATPRIGLEEGVRRMAGLPHKPGL